MSNGNKPITGTFNATGEGVTITGTLTGTVTLVGEGPAPPDPQPPEPEPEPPTPPSGGGRPMSIPYTYAMQYADTESAVPKDFKRIIQPNPNSQWGSGLTIAPGPYPPNYRIASGTEGGSFPPQGQSSNGTLPIRLQPPTSGDGQRFQFYTSATCTVLNEGNQDGKFLWGLGVIYPSELDRPMMPYLGVFHQIVDFRLMVPITVPAGKSISVTCIRLDVLDPDRASIPNWPKWKMVPNANKLYPAIGPCWWNGGPGPLNVKDIMAVGYGIPY